MSSKTMILSSPDENGRGIMTIFTEDDLLQIRIRLYNIKELNKDCKIGIYHNNKTYTSNLLKKNDVYQSSMVGDFDMNSDFFSAIIDTANNNAVRLSGGTYAGCFFSDASVFEKTDELETDSSKSGAEDGLRMTDSNSSNQAQVAEINFSSCPAQWSDSTETFNEDSSKSDSGEKLRMTDSTNSSECDDCEKCNNCPYKEFFYSHQSFDERDSSKSDAEAGLKMTNAIDCDAEHIMTDTSNSHISALLPQFEYVFQNYPEDKALTSFLPNSKFVKVTDSKDQYSLGALYENGNMKYICYAVFSEHNSTAPTELGEHYQWLPIDKDDPLSEGYYVVFQDATDLKIVEL